MADEFIGYYVLLGLKSPPGGEIHGQIANVIGHNLMLEDGMKRGILMYIISTDRSSSSHILVERPTRTPILH